MWRPNNALSKQKSLPCRTKTTNNLWSQVCPQRALLRLSSCMKADRGSRAVIDIALVIDTSCVMFFEASNIYSVPENVRRRQQYRCQEIFYRIFSHIFQEFFVSWNVLCALLLFKNFQKRF